MIVRDFKGAHPYYKFIAKANGIKDSFSERAIRAYWTGSDDLARVRFTDFEKMAKEKFFLSKIPSGSLPHHSFHVLNIGRINGKLNEDLLDVCLVKWGRVAKIKGSEATIDDYEELQKREGKFYFAPRAEKKVSWDRKMVQDLKIGDWVSIHWRHIIEKINQEQLANLKRYTKINVKACNDSSFGKKRNK